MSLHTSLSEFNYSCRGERKKRRRKMKREVVGGGGLRAGRVQVDVTLLMPSGRHLFSCTSFHLSPHPFSSSLLSSHFFSPLSFPSSSFSCLSIQPLPSSTLKLSLVWPCVFLTSHSFLCSSPLLPFFPLLPLLSCPSSCWHVCSSG